MLHFQIFRSSQKERTTQLPTHHWLIPDGQKPQFQHCQRLWGTEATHWLSWSTKHINSDVKHWCAQKSILSNPFSDVWHLTEPATGFHASILWTAGGKKNGKNVRASKSCSPTSRKPWRRVRGLEKCSQEVTTAMSLRKQFEWKGTVATGREEWHFLTKQMH